METPTNVPSSQPSDAIEHPGFNSVGLSCLVLLGCLLMYVALRGYLIRIQSEEIEKHSQREASMKRKDIAQMLRVYTWTTSEEDEETTTDATLETGTDDDSVQCAICMHKFGKGEVVCRPVDGDCMHQYHLVCCENWLVENNSCPICRRPYLCGQEAAEESV